MKRTRLHIERLEPRCVLSTAGLLGPLSEHALDLATIQPLIVAGDPSGTPPDSPSARVDANVAASPYAGVGSLEIRSGSSTYICSGSVIGPRHVLTAGHCLDLNNNGTIDVTPADITFNLNFSGSLSHEIVAADLHLHPDYTGFLNPAINDDVAVIELSEPVPAGVPIYTLNTDPPAAGERITMVGYGQAGDGVSGFYVSPAFDVKRVGSNRTDRFGVDDEGSGVLETFTGDFDGPTSATNYLGGLTLGNNLEATLGGGDSGGPSFVGEGATLELYGIDTFSIRLTRFLILLGPPAPLFGSGFGGMVVAPYVEWINSVVGTGGDVPPDVEITSPADFAAVSGTISIVADASDDLGVTQVEFLVDGASLGVDSDGGDGWSILWNTTAAGEGSHSITAIATDTASQTSADSISVVVDNDSEPAQLYFSLGASATIGGLSVARDDIVAWDGAAFSTFFDGSDVGLTDAFGTLTIDAFSIISPSEILFSFAEPGGIIGFGTFDDSDILRFTATSLGPNTAGSWSLFFRGANVGLAQAGEDIDAVELLPDGRLLISTLSLFSVPGATGRPEDLLVFSPTALGAATAGSWAFYFDGSDAGLLATSENVDGAALGPTGELYLTTSGDFAVPGLAGANEDVFVFRPTLTGATTLGSYDSVLLFDGSAHGLAGLNLNAIDVPNAAALHALAARPAAGEFVTSDRALSGQGALLALLPVASAAQTTVGVHPSNVESPPVRATSRGAQQIVDRPLTLVPATESPAGPRLPSALLDQVFANWSASDAEPNLRLESIAALLGRRR